MAVKPYSFQVLQEGIVRRLFFRTKQRVSVKNDFPIRRALDFIYIFCWLHVIWVWINQEFLEWNMIWKQNETKLKKKSLHTSQVRPIRAAYPGFPSMKQLGVFRLLPLDGKVHHRVTPALRLPVPIHTPGWREALWEQSVLPENTTQCPPPGIKPGLLEPETSALTMR